MCSPRVMALWQNNKGYSVYLLLFWITVSNGIDPFSTTFVVGTAATSALMMVGEMVGITKLGCKMGMIECCQEPYIKPNMTSLKKDLGENLYGQHIAENTVYRAVKAHVLDPDPKKTLVMSFHGWTGGGKNYVASMIIRNIYLKAEKSSFVHVFNPEVDFKHPHHIDTYKDQLQQWIKGNVSRCARSVFVFDGIDDMPEGLIDSIKPFLGTEPSVSGVDFRKSIFIFLSNTGGRVIVEKCLENWEAGKPRSSITLSETQAILEKNAYNQRSGLHLSGIIEKHLIDHFVPFLPLERPHVHSCIQNEIRRLRPGFSLLYGSNVVEDIANQLQWFPPDLRLYSKSGCKKILNKVALILSEYSDA